VTLPLLKVGVLGCVAMGVAPPYRTVWQGFGSEGSRPGFPWWNGPSGLGKFCEVLQRAGM
jgi:hypothetical protein